MEAIDDVEKKARELINRGEKKTAFDMLVSKAMQLDEMEELKAGNEVWRLLYLLAQELGEEVLEARIYGKMMLRGMLIGETVEIKDTKLEEEKIAEKGIMEEIVREASERKRSTRKYIATITKSTIFENDVEVKRIPNISFNQMSEIVDFIQQNYENGEYKLEIIDNSSGAKSQLRVTNGKLDHVQYISEEEELYLEK